jgi:hypothetical protein
MRGAKRANTFEIPEAARRVPVLFWHPRPDFYRLVVASQARWVPAIGLLVIASAVALVVVGGGGGGAAAGVTFMAVPWLALAVLVVGSPTRPSLGSGTTFASTITSGPFTLAVTASFGLLGLCLAATRSPNTATRVAD